MATLQSHLDAAYESFIRQLLSVSGISNVDELYSEILSVLLHHRRFRDNGKQSEAKTNSVIDHLQAIFHFSNKKHEKLRQIAESKKEVPLVLNLEVVEAKGLQSKDINGLSDPACTIYISPKHKENTSIKFETLEPVWHDSFSLPVSNVREETLHIEVWDYDPEERKRDKIRRISEVKSGRGLKIFLKDLATAGRREYLGCFKLPLMSIPPEGLACWFPLESMDKTECSDETNGEIHLRIGLGVQKTKQHVLQECHQVLHFLLAYELVREQNIDPYKWDGVYNNQLSKLILRTLLLQGGLATKDADLVEWLVYTKVHCEQHALHPKIFLSLLETIFGRLKSQPFEDIDELSRFWAATERLVETFASFFKNKHQHQPQFESKIEFITCAHYMLKTLELIKLYLAENPNPNMGLGIQLTPNSIVETLETAVSNCAAEFFKNTVSTTLILEESKVDHMIKVGQSLIADVEDGLEVLQYDFKTVLGIDYTGITYQVYDKEYSELVKPILAKRCGSLQLLKLIVEEDFCRCEEEEQVTTRTKLFKLYLVLTQFANLSAKTQNNVNKLSMHGTFHDWFPDTLVVQWLAIAKVKALGCIKTAVNHDTLQPIDEFAKTTSSAVDTLNILHRVEIWNQLSYPEVEGTCSISAKIIDDLCQCAIFYTDLMTKKLNQFENNVEEEYHISDELCFAIHNIECVTDEIKLMCTKIGVNFTTEKSKLRFQTKMKKTAENISNKTQGLLEDVGTQMQPVINKLIANILDAEFMEESDEKLHHYVGSSLHKLNKKLCEFTFGKVFTIIWENTLGSLESLTARNIQEKRPPVVFRRKQKLLATLVKFFHPEDSENIWNINKIHELEALLDIHGSSTSQLIMKYCKERQEVQSQSNPELGYLAVRIQYCEDIETLKIELLNARNLKPRDSEGQRDPYVKITLVTKDLVLSEANYKSKIIRKTLFPWFDETFLVPVKLTQESDEFDIQGVIMFTLKDHSVLGKREYLGDCFLPINSSHFTTGDTELKDVPQEILPLSLPTNDELNSVVFQVLESRQDHKYGSQFVKREHMKIRSVEEACQKRRLSSSSK